MMPVACSAFSCAFCFPPDWAPRNSLDPAVAFKPTAGRWMAAASKSISKSPRGYLYRDSSASPSKGDAAKAARPHFPGQEKNDDNFGRVTVITAPATIAPPIERSGTGDLPLKLRSPPRGCADAGVCYPPRRRFSPSPCQRPMRRPAKGAPSASRNRPYRPGPQNAGFWANPRLLLRRWTGAGPDALRFSR